MIEAVVEPTRSRIFNDQDAAQAFDLLSGGPVYVTDDEGKPVLDDEGNPTPALDEETGEAIVRKPQAAKFGTYPVTDKDGNALAEDATDEEKKAARDRAESKARTQGMSLDRIIEKNHGRRFGVSVWVDQDGNIVGALVPREPIKRKAKDETNGGSPEAEAEAPKKRARSRR